MKRYKYDNDFGISINTVKGILPIHWHSFYEIELCIGGRGFQYVNGVKSKIESGLITFLSPNDFHRIEATDAPIVLYHIFFYPHALSLNLLNDISLSHPPFTYMLSGEETDGFKALFDSISKEVNRSDSFVSAALRYKISLLCIDIVRLGLERCKYTSEQYQINETDASNQIISKLLPYVSEHFGEELTRDRAAELLHLCPTYFSELFKKRLGISFSEYLTSVRMSKAMRLLKYSNDSVVSIANAVGYRSTTAFYKKFKEIYRLSPGDVRRFGYENQ